MTELEKNFFETFGIERTCCNNYEKETCPEKTCTGCDYYDYPKITDRILLELICLLDFDTRCDNVETLKEKVLTDLHSLLSYMRQVHHIPDKENDIYKQVRALFGLESEGK